MLRARSVGRLTNTRQKLGVAPASPSALRDLRARRFLLLLVIGFLAFARMSAGFGASSLFSSSAPAEAAATISTDKADYAFGETVTIQGAGFVPHAVVRLSVTLPDHSVDSWSVVSDRHGGITAYYQLTQFALTYRVSAIDGKSTATTTFTDSSANLDQCTNGGVGNTPEQCKSNTIKNWVNGNANGMKAHWREGEFISYRDTIVVDANGPWTFRIQYDIVHGGKHAIDYLGSFDATEMTSTTSTAFNFNNNDPCSDKLTCTPSSPTSSFTIPGASLIN